MGIAVARVKPVEKEENKSFGPVVPLIILLKALENLFKSFRGVPEAMLKEDAGLPNPLINIAADRSMIVLAFINVQVFIGSVIALVLFHPHHKFFVDNFLSVFVRSY